MKKLFALFVAFAVIMAVAMPASAQIRFKDVPDSHWAASAVYDLVKLGVTQGYPDGTFRGTRNITRYETAILISKLAKAVGASSDVKDKLAALQADVAALKRRPAGGGAPITGSFAGSWMFGNLLAEKGGIRGALAKYRLMLSLDRDLGEGAAVAVNLDTMDYGYMQDSGTDLTGGTFATQLIDVQSKVKLDMAALGLENPVNVMLTYGPGNVKHVDDPTGSFPSEIGVTYMRPYTAAMASTSLWGMDVGGGYTAKTHPTSGKVSVSQITGTVGYGFEGVPLLNTLRVDVSGDYISEGIMNSDTRDMRATIAMAAPLGDKVQASGKFGMGGSEKKNWMVAGELALNDLWDTGTVAIVRASKVGTKFTTPTFAAAEWDLAGFDTFDRPLEDGTVNFGGEVTQTVSEDIKLIGKGDVRLTGDYKYEDHSIARLTGQGGISYNVAPNTTLDAMYRIFQDKTTMDTSDVAAVGLMYQF